MRATATLTHWNTIEIFDYGHAEDGSFYYVMEYLPGMNLEELVEEARCRACRPPRRVHFLRQVCQALRRGPRHRTDPSRHQAQQHLRLRARQGLRRRQAARLRPREKLRGRQIRHADPRRACSTGSPAFMSPEQAARVAHRKLDARSDIYSVGAVAYFLTTGQLPFRPRVDSGNASRPRL